MPSREPTPPLAPPAGETRSPAVRVRPADPSDADAIWPLVAAFATTFSPREQAFRASLPRILTDVSALVLVAEEGQHDGARVVVGYLSASAHLTFLADGEVVWVEEVMVAEPHRGAGVGAALMAHAEAWAAGRGAAYVSLASRRAGGFYRALGYEDSATFYRKLVTTGGGDPRS